MLAKYKLKKSKIEIKDFLFKCLDKYGKEASILFEGIDLENEPEYIRKLISEPYRKKFDFNLIEPSCDFSSYELRNSIIMNRQAIQIHQMDILSQFSAEIDTL